MKKYEVYSGEGLQAPGFVIEAVFNDGVSKDARDTNANTWWWVTQNGPRRDWTYIVYVKDAELAKKITRNEGIKPATYRHGINAPIHGWHFTIAYQGKRHLNKILRWCGLKELPKAARTEMQRKTLINVRGRLQQVPGREAATSGV